MKAWIMSIDFDLMSSAEIAGLIESASAVLKSRLIASSIAGDEYEKARLEAAANKPCQAEIRHITDCLRIFQKNGFVHADDVQEYRRIAAKFSDFMRLRRYPADCRGSSIRRWIDKQGAKK